MENRKLPTESEAAEWLRKEQLQLPPLRFKLKQVQVKLGDQKWPWDFVLEAEWNDERAKFAVEYKTLSTPKVFDETLQLCKSAALPAGYYPLILMPYMRQSQLEELERSRISGVDWCGNGVVIVPSKFYVFRTGNRNQFATYAPIKNIYRRNTSMVARVLLTARRFPSVQAVLSEVNRRNVLATALEETPMTMGTISKALKQLEDELIIDRTEGVRVLQPDKLLDNLSLNYDLPSISGTIRLKVDCPFERLPERFARKFMGRKDIMVATGLGSVSRYAVMQRDEVLPVYSPNISRLQKTLDAKITDRFPNVELIETADQPYYFDAQREAGFRWASPVQTYLELMAGDKRDQETAEQVKSYVLRQLGENN